MARQCQGQSIESRYMKYALQDKFDKIHGRVIVVIEDNVPHTRTLCFYLIIFEEIEGRNLGPEHSSDSLASGRGPAAGQSARAGALSDGSFSLSTPSGMAALNAKVTRQAAMVAYIDDFKLIMLIALFSIPLLLLHEAR